MKAEELKCPVYAAFLAFAAVEGEIGLVGSTSSTAILDAEGHRQHLHRVASRRCEVPGAKTVECPPECARGRVLDIGSASFDESFCVRPGLGTVRPHPEGFASIRRASPECGPGRGTDDDAETMLFLGGVLAPYRVWKGVNGAPFDFSALWHKFRGE